MKIWEKPLKCLKFSLKKVRQSVNSSQKLLIRLNKNKKLNSWRFPKSNNLKKLRYLNYNLSKQLLKYQKNLKSMIYHLLKVLLTKMSTEIKTNSHQKHNKKWNNLKYNNLNQLNKFHKIHKRMKKNHKQNQFRTENSDSLLKEKRLESRKKNKERNNLNCKQSKWEISHHNQLSIQ